MRVFLRKVLRRFLRYVYGGDSSLLVLLEDSPNNNFFYNSNILGNSTISPKAKVYPRYAVVDSQIGDYTYIAQNAIIHHSSIGKFCSIGPNLVCGWGIHPTHGISTSPMFYSTVRQNGTTFSEKDKVEEIKRISVGNDVFIGMNVTILDGITIGNGAVVGAGCVVSKDIEPYAIVVGNPMRVIKHRFEKETIQQLLKTNWWDWSSDEQLQEIEKHIFDVDLFLEKYSK